MLSAGDESIIVQISIVAGIAALTLTAVFIVIVLALRRSVVRRRRNREAVEERWLPVMLRVLRGSVDDVPPLRRREQVVVLAAWNRLVSSVSGQATDRLRAFARVSGLADAAQHLLRKGRPAERLVATIFVGHQQDLRAAGTLRDLTEKPEPLVRAEAARALVRLDPVSGARLLAPKLADWEDCHPATAVAILAGAPDEAVAEAIGAHVFVTDDPVRRTRMLEILGTVQAPRASEVAQRLLRETIEPELIARCLDVLRANLRPQDAVLVRRFLRHPTPFVRVRAVATLARLEGPGDEWRILATLDDSDWWVRHRAAEAVLGSPRFDRRFLEMLARVHPDRYARGALNQLLTERAP